MQSFIFGSGTDAPTYEQLKRKREIADMLAQRSLNGGQADTAVGGLASAGSSIAQALMARYADKQLQPQEAAERSNVAQEMARIQSGLGPQGISQDDYGALAGISDNPYASPAMSAIAQSLMRRQVMPGAPGGIPAFARGGIAPGGLALVGEQGPEVVNLPRGARVFPNMQVAQSDAESVEDAQRRFDAEPTDMNGALLDAARTRAGQPAPADPGDAGMGRQGNAGFGRMSGTGEQLAALPSTGPQVAEADTGTKSDASGMKLTEGQSKDLNFWNRMDAVTGKIDEHSAALLDRGQQVRDAVPMFGNSLVSEDYQRGRRDANEWITALLRKDTGAAVTKEEWDLYGPIYIPQPGDGPETLKDKAEARARAAEGMKKGLGTAEVMANELMLERQKKAAPAPAAAGDDWRSQDPSTWTDEQLQEFLK